MTPDKKPRRNPALQCMGRVMPGLCISFDLVMHPFREVLRHLLTQHSSDHERRYAAYPLGKGPGEIAVSEDDLLYVLFEFHPLDLGCALVGFL